MSTLREWLATVTWRCDICRRERPDAKISVQVIDIGLQLYAVADTAFRNVKFCNDNPHCHDAAIAWDEREHRDRERRR
jgi:hypothetical protein